MLGFPAAFFWPSLVILFLVGVMFLQMPKLYLLLMFLFYGFFAAFASSQGVRVIPVRIPLERVLDEIFLVVPLAVIVMRFVQKTSPREETRLGLFFPLLAALSWYVNNVPTLNALRVTLAYMKFYILWYFVRCIGPWSEKERRRLFRLFVFFALVQVVVNMAMWQRGIWARMHPDCSVGTIGSAHFVGYVSAFALFMVGAWILFPSEGRRPLVTLAGAAVLLLIGYNLVFLTDTKHGLFIAPFAGLPLVVHPRLAWRKKLALITGAVVFCLASWIYFRLAQVYVVHSGVRTVWQQVRRAGKGAILRVIFTVFPRELPFFPLGAGPGNFCSSVGLFSLRPLAVKYVLPHTPWAYGGGQVISTSFLGGPFSGFNTLVGEFGVPGAALYYLFWAHVLRHLWRRARDPAASSFDAGQRTALVCSILFFVAVNFLFEVFIIHIFTICLAVLVGAHWDEPPRATAQPAATRRTQLPQVAPARA